MNDGAADLGIAARLAAVRERIAVAALASARDPNSIRLVAVSKTKDERAIREAYAAGQRDFGENYAQELSKKAGALEDLADIRWHFIGHLQRNKAKVVVRSASVVHTVDSTRLAEELGKRAAEAPIPAARAFEWNDARLPVLVEVNVGAEEQKSGCRSGDVAEVLSSIEKEGSLRLAGLMTVPPASPDAAASRRFFDELVRLRDVCGGSQRLPHLSMGMSHDLEEAVAAGATIVRVGSAIFGARRP